MEEYLTTEQVGEDYNIPVATLRWWRHRGDVGPRSIKLGGLVRYRRTDCEAWISAQLEQGRGGALEPALDSETVA